ncbi:MAG: hypothetical protein JXA52_09165, partial [Planctomycetes bacterium]|nr:hypothetical protein [Planctomycetota bacterium]
MRTAEDIVNEYRRRKYDTFRIRAIAALRPEPMRGQILALLDAEETAEAAFEEVGAEVMVDAPVSATLDVMSDVLAEEIDLIDEIEEVAEAEPVAMNLVEEDAEEELEPAMAASSTLF